MNKILFCVFLYVIALSSNGNTYSQDKYKTEHISLEYGIANNLIYSTYQDSKGLLWFGTMFGLVRYDGFEFRTYRYDPLDTNTLSNDDIISIFEDKDGNLWTGTFNGGLNKLDRKTEKFTRYLSDNKNNSLSDNTVWDIFQDSRGIMWFGTGGGGLCRFENGSFKSYRKDSLKEGSISGNIIRCIEEDEEGNLWIGTAGEGLNKFNIKSETFTVYRNNPEDPKSIYGNTVNCIVPDKNGVIWAGTGKGLNRFDGIKNEFTFYAGDTLNSSSLNSGYIYTMAKDGEDHLLIGSVSGLKIYNKINGHTEHIRIYPGRNIPENVISFIKDKSGIIWLSIYLDGLHKVCKNEDKFKSFFSKSNVKCIYESRDGILYAGTSNGLELTDQRKVNFRTYLHDSNNSGSLSSSVINSVSEDKEGNIWIGTDNGLNKFNPETESFRRYYSTPENPNSLSSSNILKILTDRKGILWIGTDKGLDKIDKDFEKVTHYRNSENDINSLSENTILSLYEDSDSNIWAGTYKGLNRLDRNTGKFTRFVQNPKEPGSISNNYVFSFCEDSFGNFWTGTGGGLNVFDKKSGSFFHYSEKDGLPNGVINGIEEDGSGNLWISTMKGVSKFNIKSRTFRNYDIDDGLQSNMFNPGAYFKSANGEIYFGSVSGMNSIFPPVTEERNYIPEVMLVSMTIPDGNKKSEQDISFVSRKELNYTENNLGFKFASTDYYNPVKNRFAYKLEGFDRDWIFSGRDNAAYYSNLDPGNYFFKVKTVNPEGVWSVNEAVLTLIINPPFWKTLWFYVLISVIIISGLVFIHKYRIRKELRNAAEIEKIKEFEREKMREQASRDYHDELGHKLTRISLYSRRINRKLRPAAKGLTEDLNSIVETSNSLQRGAKDLIWALNPKEDTLYDFAVRLKDFGNELFENTGIKFNFSGPESGFRNVILSMNSKRHLIYIFKEGMNNILKYACCSEVNLRFSMYGGDLEILLEDNGNGFDINNCPKGYGLKNIFSRSAQININVNISSSENKGTRITLKTTVSNLVTA